MTYRQKLEKSAQETTHRIEEDIKGEQKPPSITQDIGEVAKEVGDAVSAMKLRVQESTDFHVSFRIMVSASKFYTKLELRSNHEKGG